MDIIEWFICIIVVGFFFKLVLRYKVFVENKKIFILDN